MSCPHSTFEDYRFQTGFAHPKEQPKGCVAGPLRPESMK